MRMKKPAETRADHFERQSLAWAALHHFLPADLLREWLAVLVRQVSQDTIEIGDLFEDQLIAPPGEFTSWILRPREPKSPLIEYLQQRIRYLIWKHDDQAFINDQHITSDFGLNPRLLESAITLGFYDLGADEAQISALGLPESGAIHMLTRFIAQACEVFRSGGGQEKLIFDLTQRAKSIEMPLRAVVLKHVGDLCVDADLWNVALSLYRESHQLLTARKPTKAWVGFYSAFGDVVVQSIGTATFVLEGAKKAATYYTEQLESHSLKEAPLLYSNASHDAYYSDAVASDGFSLKRERRASMLMPPLLLDSLDVAHPYKSWAVRDFDRTHQCFKSLLRRQIALGGAAEVRETQGAYAKSLIDSFARDQRPNRSPDLFHAALVMLVQSENVALAGMIDWDPAIIRDCVDSGMISRIISISATIDAASERRARVVVEIFNQWLLHLPSDREGLARQMIDVLIEYASRYRSTGMANRNLGTRSMASLRTVGEKRPEFRHLNAEGVLSAILRKLDIKEYWTGIDEAFKAAECYADQFDSPQLKALHIGTLDLLDQIDPSKEIWVVVQPAINLLVDQAMRTFAKTEKKIENRVVETIVRFGLNQTTEHARLLFQLSELDLAPALQSSLADQIKTIAAKVRKQAQNINASNCIFNIVALLVAPQAAGPEGISEIFDTLTRVIDSAFGAADRVAMAFSSAYQVLNVLAVRQSEIASAIGMDVTEFRSSLIPIHDRALEVWRRAPQIPMIFSLPSLPRPTSPNPIVIHNWAFGSMEFSRSLGLEEALFSAFEIASQNQQIASAISLAKAGRLRDEELDGLKTSAMLSEDAETFYGAIGFRLSSLHLLETEARNSVIDVIVDRCLQFGPRPLDAAVFVAAGRTSVLSRQDSARFKEYRTRVQHHNELRAALMPFLH